MGRSLASESLKYLTLPSWTSSLTAPATSSRRHIRVDAVLIKHVYAIGLEVQLVVGAQRTPAALACMLRFGNGASIGRLSCMVVSSAWHVVQALLERRFPNTSLLHQCNLAVYHLLFILGVAAGDAIQV